MADQPAAKPVEFIDILLACGLVVWVTLIILILAFVAIPDDNMPLFASVASGGVVGLLTALAQNRWGSSKGSAAKDEVIGAIAKKAAE